MTTNYVTECQKKKSQAEISTNHSEPQEDIAPVEILNCCVNIIGKQST